MSEAILSTTAIKPQEQQKDWTPAKVTYTALMAFNLLSFIWLLATGSGIDNMPLIIWITRLVAVPFAIHLGRLWKDKGFLILLTYTSLFFLRVFIPAPGDLFQEEVAENVLSALWLFTACYGLGRILTTEQLKHFLFICTILWTAFMAVLCSIGIYAVWTEKPVYLLHDAIVYLYEQRLNIIYLATTSGSLTGFTILIGILMAVCIKSHFCKTGIVLMLLPVILATALTDSRTAFVSVPAGIAVMFFFGVFYHVKAKEEPVGRKKNWKPWVFGIITMVFVFVLLVFLFLQITPVFNRIRMQGIIPRAYAEETVKTSVATRGFTGSRVLTGRAELWEEVIEHIRQNPIILLTGESKLAPLRKFDNYYAHTHCLYLQVLLESGIPGLLLFLSFILYTLINAMWIIRIPETPRWLRLLPALPISLWVGDIAETFTWLRSSQCPMGAVALISSGIICAKAFAFIHESESRRNEKAELRSVLS